MNSIIWVEKYRPKSFNEIILPNDIKNYFENIIKNNYTLPNCIFAGPAGTGKTSLAKIIAKELDMDMMYINASKDNSLEILREKIYGFAKTLSITGQRKLVFLDEAEKFGGNLTNSQDALKVVIEETYKNTSFVLSTNNLQKIIEPLQSRCQIFYFGDFKTHEIMLDIKKQYATYLLNILKNENVEFEKNNIVKIVNMFFPDLRKIINETQKIVIQNGNFLKLDMSIIQDDFISLLSCLKTHKYVESLSIIKKINPNEFYNKFYDTMRNFLEDDCIIPVVQILANFEFKNNIVSNKELNLASCVSELMDVVKFKKE